MATRYVVGALLGRGGMGAVYAARDTALGRDVALKELQPELVGDPGASARLAREAAITSRLDHPGIVAVHDVGRLPDGRLFYTMRLVRGRTLARAIAEAADPIARRTLVRHLLSAAEAVAAAHDGGIVHRDLKPANILIGAHGETQVVDWGLATSTRAAIGRWRDLPASAATGSVGTPRYAAPEQSRGDPPDPCHDVWSLGVTLAEVVGADIPSELSAIVTRATAAQPEDRYPDASAFADDLLRWFEGRRVVAYSYTPIELLGRTIAAWRLPLAIGAVGLVASTIAVAVGWRETTRSLERALVAEADARSALAGLRIEQAVDATRAGRREAAERLALQVLEEREDPLARGIFAAFGRSARPTLLRDEPGPACAWSTLAPSAAWVLCGMDDAVSRWEAGRAAWSAPVAATGGEVHDDVVLLWDAAGATTALDPDTGELRGRWPLSSGGWVPQVPPRAIWTGAGIIAAPQLPPARCESQVQVAAVSSRGRFAAFCGDGTLVLGTAREPAQRLIMTEVAGDHAPTSLVWTPDETLLVGTLRGRVYEYDGHDGALVAMGVTELGTIGTLRVSPDGASVALGGARGGIGIWRRDTATLLGEIPADRTGAFAFAADGLRVHDVQLRTSGPQTSGPQTSGLRTWRLPGGAPSVVRGGAGLADIAASADGFHVATAGGDGAMTTIDLRTGHIRRAMLGDRVVKGVAFGADGLGLLAAGMAEPYVVIDDEAGGRSYVLQARSLRRVAWLGGGVVVGTDLHAGLYRWATPGAPPTVLAHDRMFIDLERDGDALVVVDTQGRVERVEGDSFTRLAVEAGARAVALRGPILAIAGEAAVDVYAGGGPARRLDAPGASLVDVALSPDGARVAAGALDGTIRVWEVASGRLVGVLPGHTERVSALEFLPDGDLVSASWDKSARFWSLRALDLPVDGLAAELAAGWGWVSEARGAGL